MPRESLGGPHVARRTRARDENALLVEVDQPHLAHAESEIRVTFVIAVVPAGGASRDLDRQRKASHAG